MEKITRAALLPKYAPKTNPIERIWWHLHEPITRNHRCHSIDQLLDQVCAPADAQQSFYFQPVSILTLYKLTA